VSDGQGQLQALTGGYHAAFLVGAVFALAAAIAGYTLIRESAPAGAHGHGEAVGEPAVESA
jgi:hypothetical protein